ncbi:M81 family metallopeptidase [Salipiger abyssi]|uniref:M81 family metallopeptidase n=1 Tax=Salipiger abyssi TaxID=1250539 RepID=UPI0040598164
MTSPKRPRVLIAGISHETNSFAAGQTPLEKFLATNDFPGLQTGDEIVAYHRGRNFGTSGFLARMEDEAEIVPAIWMHGGAGGPAEDAVLTYFCDHLLEAFDRAGPVDAIYLDLHGSMVTPGWPDAEGEILRRLRGVTGPDLPIVASMDYHGNLSRAMVGALDGLSAYRTYPHIDRAETGARAAEQLLRIWAEGRPKEKALLRSDFLIPLPFECTLTDPSRMLVAMCEELPEGVSALEYVPGFPAADTAETGPAVLAIGCDAAAVRAAAERVFQALEAAERDFAIPVYSPEAAVARAAELRGTGPVLLADTQDNPGGGGAGDTTGLLKAMVAADLRNAALAIMIDGEAAQAAHAAGAGARLRLALGGKHGPEGVTPLEAVYEVRALSDGQFRATGKVVGGREIDLGLSAVLRLGGIDIVTASNPMQPYDPEVFAHLGLDPAGYDMLGLKSSVHFRADFEPLSRGVLIVRAPGWHLIDLDVLPYRNLREGMRLGPLGKAFGA